jgi:alanyl-tRNA synthetase
MFYWKKNDEKAPEIFDPKNKNWVEIWNDVFMQYVKDENGVYQPAKQKNVDTGMGLERTLAVLNGKESVYETDLFEPIISEIRKLFQSSQELKNLQKVERIIADHIKASVFLTGEGIVSSNVERGYVLRRLIRRVVRYTRMLKASDDFLEKLIKEVIEIYSDVYPELRKKESGIISIVRQEEEKFEKTLEKALKELDNIPHLTGEIAFDLYQSYGLPLEVAEEIKPVENREVFFEKIKEHQKLSQTASAGMFRGGLADASEQTTKYHTATHLLLAGLRKFLSEHVTQKGSNITAERIRFDFSHSEKMSSSQVADVENFVNDIIKKDLPVWFEEMSLEDARKINAMGVFESKYGEKVKVYFIGKGDENVSKEICGGPHVTHTGILGYFKIQKEESSSAGVRRIKAILE